MTATLVCGARPQFPDTMRPDARGLVAVGGDLTPETIVEAARKGAFAWSDEEPIPWYSPDPRAVLVPRAFRWDHGSEALRRKVRVTMDTAFEQVVTACATVPRRAPGTWIGETLRRAWSDLHAKGVTHSVEVWDGADLVGGLIGHNIGAVFFGETMFHVRRDASKVALGVLCGQLHAGGVKLIDCQQDTAHLRRLGATAVPRLRYLLLLRMALEVPDRWPRVVAN